ncbi:MAG: response regulator, partial [Lachnospiraceae bacterium]|nr:response regulator [Lachnospiraceae bacterium]
ENIPQRLYGDSSKIKQVVLNLLTNAVKYTDDGGFVLGIRAYEVNDVSCTLKISVKDTGIGIKPEDQAKLFTAYERLDEEKNVGIQGTGLGLDISRQYAELMGGTLECKSTYGEGSEFILTVSQKVADSRKIGVFREYDNLSEADVYMPQFIAPDADILVVDDNPMNLAVIKGLLKPTKVFVTTADSGKDCLDKLKTGNYNVVLLDHMMPGMDGIETCARIREDYPDLPVYALTANATAGGDEFYKSKGFNGYLAKPIDIVAVEHAIMRHLPEEIMHREVQVSDKNSDELPENMKWLENLEMIDTVAGIKNCGSEKDYIYSLRMFLETSADVSKVIRDAHSNGDIKLYTIKVHALKSSARIIGAMKLSKLCEELEYAGAKLDLDFIEANDTLMTSEFSSVCDALKPLSDKSELKGSKPMISEADLNEAYDALLEVIPQMDYEAVEMILSDLNGYELPKEDRIRVDDIERYLKLYDWDSMEDICRKRK